MSLSENPPTVPPAKVSTKSKKKTKKSVDPSKLTPEYIEEQRRLRNEKKQKKLLEQGEVKEEKIEFIKRPMLKVGDQVPDGSRDSLTSGDFIPSLPTGPKDGLTTDGSIHNETRHLDGLPVKILSYNILAQSLIRRKLFPTNGNALKWTYRSKVMLHELKHYDADILCLQEVDHIQYHSFWSKEFEKMGYLSKFYRSAIKNHGLAIVYRASLFVCKHQSFINYDKERASGLPFPRTITQNVGFLIHFEFKQEILDKYPCLKQKNGLIIGTTHMFWHPFGTFERTRQAYLVLSKFREFQNVLTSLGYNKGFYSFFAGDFNSQPFDSPYLSITAKPIKYVERAKKVIACSLSYQYSKNRGVVDEGKVEGEGEGEEGVEAEEGVDAEEGVEAEEAEEAPEAPEVSEATKAPEASEVTEDSESPNSPNSPEDSDSTTTSQFENGEEGGNVEKFGKDQPRDPVPDTFNATEEQLELVKQMQDVHNSLEMRAISLYSLGYKSVHPQNAGLDNERGEPTFSNWAHTWRGLLDYIFVVSKWDKDTEDFTQNVDSLEDLELKQSVRLLELLRLPLPEEMGPEPSGQPRVGQYPSDHLCLMAKVELR